MKTKKMIAISKLGSQWEMENPFLFCAHHRDQYPRANSSLGPDIDWSGRNQGSDFSGKDGFSMYHGRVVPGFPAHPHCGFETVTIIAKGFVDHFDSSGATGRYGDGDVQWLTTGAGCQHSEMFPLLRSDAENPIELFQLWLNLPASAKKAEPHYRMLWAEKIPEVQLSTQTQPEVRVRLIAGKINEHESLKPAPDSWAGKPENHVNIWLITMEAEATMQLPAVSPTLLRNLYFYQGQSSLSIEGIEVEPQRRIKLSGQELIHIRNGKATAHLLLLEGEPIREPVFQYGPFVANSREAILQAIDEYQSSAYGGWPWASAEIVHPAQQGRFARYADGHEETP